MAIDAIASCGFPEYGFDDTRTDAGGQEDVGPSCTNGREDGDETGIDCGGSCPPCGVPCTPDGGADGSCRPATCANNVMDPGESDVDCGGPCAPCALGRTCKVSADCVMGVCASAPASVDGGTPGDAGGVEASAADASIAETGASDGPVEGTTPSDATIPDAVAGDGPAAVDGSGADAATKDGAAPANGPKICRLPDCADGLRDGSETDIDCGGSCGPCANGSGCNSPSDCLSHVCTNSRCQVPTCHDLVKNGQEADVDCGGPSCSKCMNARACSIPSDCLSATCDMNVCRPATCTDNARNGTETDIDCGGGGCNGCGTGQKCGTKNDCRTNNCVSNACQPLAGTGTGLRGEYFDNIDLTNQKLVRTDAQINVPYNGTSPDPSIAPTTFSIRWTGLLQPQFTETYTFYVLSDDGARLWVSGKKLTDDWKPHTPKEDSGTIALEATKQYEIHLEYFQSSGNGQISLSWESPSTPKSIVPTLQLYPAPAPANLVVNGDFETGVVAPWQNSGGAAVVMTSPFAGQYVAQIPAGVSLEQTLTTRPGETYTIFVYGKAAAGSCNVLCSLLGGAVPMDISLPVFGPSYAAGSSTFTTGGDTSSVRVRVQNAAGSLCFADEISLVKN